MARIVLEEEQGFAVFPEGSILLVKVDNIEEREVQGSKGTWTKLEFKFKVMDIQSAGDGSDASGYSTAIGAPIWGSVSARFTTNPENRLRQWVEAILGMELTAGFDLDTDLLVGKQVRAITSQYTKRNGHQAHQVDALLPMKKGSSPAPAASAWQDEEPPF